MTDNERINRALMLNQETDKIHRFYEEWARHYDQDVLGENYSGPDIIARLATALYADENGATSSQIRSTTRVLDAGCGTGLAGIALHAHGFENLTGIDLSLHMIEIARRTDVYRILCGNVDLTKPISAQISKASGQPAAETDQYDMTVCVGVFTLGHVPPTVLFDLIEITRPGGLMLATVREEYCEEHNFEGMCRELEATGKAAIVHAEWGDYVREDRALYIALKPN